MVADKNSKMTLVVDLQVVVSECSLLQTNEDKQETKNELKLNTKTMALH